MAVRLLLFASLLLRLVQYCNSNDPTLTFVPQSPLVLSPNDTATGGTKQSLSITCRQPAGKLLKGVILYRNGDLIFIQNDEPRDQNGTGGLPQIIDNATGTTSSGSLAEKYVTLTYSQASCDLTGLYTCYTVVFLGGGANYQDRTINVNYTVAMGPGKATINVTSEGNPPGVAVYKFRNVVLLKCTVDVGTVVPSSTQVNFIWQYKDAASSQPFENYSNLNDIDNSETPLPADLKCQTERRTSILRRMLTTEDSSRQYRCYIQKDNQTFVDLAGQVEIARMNGSDAATPGTSPGVMSTYDIVVPAAIGGSLFIAIIIVVVIARRAATPAEGNRRPSRVIVTQMADTAPVECQSYPDVSTSDYTSDYTSEVSTRY